ncbi:hypothetical protein QAD02_002434 [Eretmocerus hayati]|uniref:Uncharacterized protein n=1 Tax=Eretmocerus hayati TaxID=131215 RepID=A0ACC2NNQ8_9HYME|nr:hypothetical protein QAD02_002434 [Eretmocerus hayati]
MVPYRKSANKTIGEMIFDIRVTEPRKTVERAFGSLCSRFQVCAEKLGFDVNTSKNIILCCMSMHNYLITVRMEENLDLHDDEESEDSGPETDDDSDDSHENFEIQGIWMTIVWMRHFIHMISIQSLFMAMVSKKTRIRPLNSTANPMRFPTKNWMDSTDKEPGTY